MPRTNPHLITTLVLLVCGCARAANPSSTTQSGGQLPHVQFDARTKTVRIECEAVNVKAPLEFFCVTSNGPLHETVLSTAAKPSDIHAALLAMGLEPGSPVKYSEATRKWIPPHGPPLQIDVKYEKDGRIISAPAYRWMRNVKTKDAMPPLTWIFAGSRVMDDGNYAADVTGYIVSVVNFDLTVIDIPDLASNSNEFLEWEQNPDLVPAAGTKVTMILQPAGSVEAPRDKTPPEEASAPDPAEIDMPLVKIDDAGQITLDDHTVDRAALIEELQKMKSDRPLKVIVSPARTTDYEMVSDLLKAIEAAGIETELRSGASATQPAADDEEPAISNVHSDEKEIEDLLQYWRTAVRPHRQALEEASQAHYDVIRKLRRQQQGLIDEADRIQRAIDQLEKEYQNLTTPKPEQD